MGLTIAIRYENERWFVACEGSDASSAMSTDRADTVLAEAIRQIQRLQLNVQHEEWEADMEKRRASGMYDDA